MVTKFSAALSGLKDAKNNPAPEAAPEPTRPPIAKQPPPPPAPKTRGPGRPKGRSSSRDYVPTTVLMNRKLKAKVMASIVVAKANPKIYGLTAPDLSRVIEYLLEDYLKWYDRKTKEHEDRDEEDDDVS